MNRDFDCVEMKHNAAQKIQMRLASFTRKEEIKFWESRTEQLRIQKRRAERQSKTYLPKAL
jgi:hypothetical protein